MPATAWAAAGNPHLFDRAAAHHRARRELADRARTLADLLGTTVVPHLPPGSPPRGAVLALRRRLHSGAAPDTADRRLLTETPEVPPLVRQRCQDLYEADRALSEEYEALGTATEQEWERVGELCWDLARTHPVMRVFLDSTAPELTATAERRLARGERWSSPRLRKNCTFLWRALARAAMKTTPRDWVGQIAPVPITPAHSPHPLLLAPGSRLTAMAAEVSHNVHTLRTRLGALDLTTADATTVIAPAPLHFTPLDDAGDSTAGGHLCCAVLDPARPGTLRRIDVVRTQALDAVLARLTAGPRPLGEIVTDLLGGLTGDRAEPAGRALRGFLAHLHRLGVLETCAPPRRVHSGWTAPGTALPHPTPWPGGAAAVPADWFLDSYRRAETPGRRPLTVSAEATDVIHAGLRTAARLAALRKADLPDPADLPAPLPGLDAEPRPLLAFLAPLTFRTDETDAEAAPDTPHPAPPQLRQTLYDGWPPARTPGSGYAHLLDLLGGHLDDESFDIDDTLLDALGAPKAQESMPPWPLDCLVRPLAPADAGPGPVPLAVLESASPAGVLDARFADTLDTLTGGYGNTSRLRAFLAAVERAADVDFVEVLVPPLDERAANAVRRPRLTSWWTGDPDPAPYHGTTGLTGARHLPLDRITLRREGARVIAEADGRRIVPVHHATRSPVPPYDQLLRVLLTARHPGTAEILRLDGLADAFPEARRVPRLTVGGGRLVVSPRTHRVPDPDLWHPDDSDRDKLLHLAALRARTALPRHGFARPRTPPLPAHDPNPSPTPGPPSPPPPQQTPVDLAALPTLRTIDRLRAQHGRNGFLIEEALPAPGHHLLRDEAHADGDAPSSSAAQLLLRSPHALDALVDAAAAALRG
ncbi:lantibiotic dehydratase [Streptomyces sp. NPDC059477]|uniref:lantibiotic dehydratase n=1 Tax=Streptomyces sp. NPDC059477 TaxID=3346847 RepID=UPI0036BB6243